jgi:hypothetical protein
MRNVEQERALIAWPVYGSGVRGQPLPEVGEYLWPRLLVPVLRVGVRKPRASQAQPSPARDRRELNSDHGFGSPRPGDSGDLRQLDQPIPLEPQEPSVVRVAAALVARLEEEGGVHLRRHQNKRSPEARG